jgi:glucose-6-phosphate isomerase
MVGARSHEDDLRHQHELLIANCLAQSEALMRGRSMREARALMEAKGHTGDALERHAAARVFPGNRPSVTLVYPLLTPEVLGQIVALYEHRVFVEGTILGINSFDQWGVELGKELAKRLLPVVEGKEEAHPGDGSTALIAAYLKRHR